MRKLVCVLMLLSLVLFFFGCQEEKLSSESSAESESSLSSDELYDVLRDMGYSGLQIIKLERLFENGVSAEAALDPFNNAEHFGRVYITDDGEYILGSARFDENETEGVAYIVHKDKTFILSEIPSAETVYGILDDEHYMFADTTGIRIYGFDDFSKPRTVWNAPYIYETNPYWDQILTVYPMQDKGLAAVFWINRPMYFEEGAEPQPEDSAAYYKLSFVNANGRTADVINTGISLMRDPSGEKDLAYPEIILYDGEKLRFRISDKTFDFFFDDYGFADVDEAGDSSEVKTGPDAKYGLFVDDKYIIEPVYDSCKRYPNFIVFGKEISEGVERVKIFDYSGNQIGFEYNKVEPSAEYENDYAFKGILTEGTMLTVEYDESGEPCLAEIQAHRTYLLDEYGNPLVDVPFEDYYIESDYIVGTNSGSRYHYELQDDVFVLTDKTDPQKTECECGFTHTNYCFYWYGGYFKHGLNIGSEVFLEPVYSGIYVPFSGGDRVVLYYGSYMQGWECGRCKIIDLDKNVLCEKFNRVSYKTFDDGSYIGIGIACGPNAETVVYDEKGEPMPNGFWFIDKDGNILSEKFSFYSSDDEWHDIPDPKSPDEIMILFYDDGTFVKISVSKYLCK